MHTLTQTRPSNGAIINLLVNATLEDFKSIYYNIVETDLSIQNVDDIINRLKCLHDGYLPELQIQKAIQELEALKTKLMQYKTTSTGESLQIEIKLLNLIDGG